MRITHIQRLKPSEFTDVFFRAIDPLRTARRLGPVLFQLPPAMKCDEALLGDFLATLPRDMRYAFEFRHDSWLQDAVYRLLEKHGASLCLAESEKLVMPQVVTANFVYSRLRMPEYSADDRKEIAARVGELLNQGRDVYVFFKHEDTPAGALYAEELLKAFPEQASRSRLARGLVFFPPAAFCLVLGGFQSLDRDGRFLRDRQALLQRFHDVDHLGRLGAAAASPLPGP